MVEVVSSMYRANPRRAPTSRNRRRPLAKAPEAVAVLREGDLGHAGGESARFAVVRRDARRRGRSRRRPPGGARGARGSRACGVAPRDVRLGSGRRHGRMRVTRRARARGRSAPARSARPGSLNSRIATVAGAVGAGVEDVAALPSVLSAAMSRGPRAWRAPPRSRRSVTGLVGVDEDEVEGAGEAVHRLEGRALPQLDAVG